MYVHQEHVTRYHRVTSTIRFAVGSYHVLLRINRMELSRPKICSVSTSPPLISNKMADQIRAGSSWQLLSATTALFRIRQKCPVYIFLASPTTNDHSKSSTVLLRYSQFTSIHARISSVYSPKNNTNGLPSTAFMAPERPYKLSLDSAHLPHSGTRCIIHPQSQVKDRSYNAE